MIRNILTGPVLQWFAKGSILNTFVAEGTVKAVMRGESFYRFLMSFEGYHLNDPLIKATYNEQFPPWEVIYHGPNNPNGYEKEWMEDRFYDQHVRGELLLELGLYPVGMPWERKVKVFQFAWNETRTDLKEGYEIVYPRADATDFAYVSDFTYAIVTKGAETRENLQIDAMTLVTVAIRNPYRALFGGEDWMRRATAAINAQVRAYIGTRRYQELITSNAKEMPDGSLAASASPTLSRSIMALTDLLPSDSQTDPISRKGLHARYGIVIRTADLQTITLAGKAKDQHEEAATKCYTAEREAEATRIKGSAEADVIAMKGEKEAAALKTRLDIIEKSPHGIRLAELDAMVLAGEKGNTIIWPSGSSGPPPSVIIDPRKGGAK